MYTSRSYTYVGTPHVRVHVLSYVFECVCVCVCICIYACMHACMDGWMDGWMDLAANACLEHVVAVVHVDLRLLCGARGAIEN